MTSNNNKSKVTEIQARNQRLHGCAPWATCGALLRHSTPTGPNATTLFLKGSVLTPSPCCHAGPRDAWQGLGQLDDLVAGKHLLHVRDIPTNRILLWNPLPPTRTRSTHIHGLSRLKQQHGFDWSSQTLLPWAIVLLTNVETLVCSCPCHRRLNIASLDGPSTLLERSNTLGDTATYLWGAPEDCPLQWRVGQSCYYGASVPSICHISGTQNASNAAEIWALSSISL